jgi:uncharacterized membrane protein
MIDLAIVALSIVGFLISSYFTAIAYRWIRPDERWIPASCRMGEQTCASIVFTPRARVFGLPNSVLGQLYYASLIGGAPLDLLDGEFYTLFLAASTLTVLLAIYLTYSLLFITRVPCTLCFISHAINFTIFLLLLALG